MNFILFSYKNPHLLYPLFLPIGLLVPFAPVVDGLYGGDFLPDYPDAIMNKGNYHGTKVPFLTGVTKDEVSIWFQNGNRTNFANEFKRTHS